jgi:hypothetical protein
LKKLVEVRASRELIEEVRAEDRVVYIRVLRKLEPFAAGGVVTRRKKEVLDLKTSEAGRLSPDRPF